MQASPNSSIIKLTTKSSTTTVTPTPTSGIYKQHNISTITTSGDSIKVTKSIKTNLGKKTTSINVDPCASKEIEEISKKISEHADAIYRTWKSRGLAPTELLDIYTNAATAVVVEKPRIATESLDIFGGTVEAAAAAGSTEGLQKLVSQFVIKDKEQRGVKSTYSGSKIAVVGGVVGGGGGGGGVGGLSLHKSQRTVASSLAADQIAGIMPENIGNKITQKTGVVGVGGALKQYTSKTTNIHQKPTTTTTNTSTPSTASAISLKSAKSNENLSVKKLAKSTGATPSTTTTTTTSNAKTTSSKIASSPLLASSSKSSTSLSTPTSSSSLTSTASPIKNNVCAKNVNSVQQRTNNNSNNNSILANKHNVATTPQSTSATSLSTSSSSSTTMTAATKPSTPTTKRTMAKGNSSPTLDINLNLDLGFDALQLDVNSLSQLQSQNLLKIKELLQDNTTTTTAHQEPKKTATTTKVTTKVKRAKSPAKLLESNTVTDSPIVTKTKLTKLLNENEQINNNNNYNSTTTNNNTVKKTTTKATNNIISSNNNNKSNSNIKQISVSNISDKSNNSAINNSIDSIVSGGIDDATIMKLINTSDLSGSGKTISTISSTPSKIKPITTTKSTIAKTSSPTSLTTTTTTTTPAVAAGVTVTNSSKAAATINEAKIATQTAAASTATATSATIANAVSSVKTLDHQSINKALDSNSGGSGSGSGSIIDGSSAKKQSQALNENASQRSISPQKSTKRIAIKESKTNGSELKTNSKNINNSSDNNSILTAPVGTAKAPKSVKSGNSSKAAAAAASASSTAEQSVMEIAPSGNNKVNGNTNNNSNGNDNSSSSNMPAPTKLNTGRTAVAQDKLNRPFLTRGSVAERVLMFEKCPGVRNSFLDIKRPDLDVLPKSLRKVSVKLHATPPGNQQQPEQNSLQKEIRTTRSVYIPRFYFPHGKPQPQIAQERTIRGILAAFDSFPNNQVTKDELPKILKICGLPFYWRMPVVVFCQQNNNGLVERSRFLEFWKQMNIYCHDAASRFVYIHSRGQRFRSYIAPEDMVPLVQDVVDTHPGLAFLKEATEFHSRYVHTVIARIFYSVNRSWSGRITISELKKSDLLEIITLLEEEDDINQIMAFFSYEHFYVIYCKFWELDKDHDLLINQDDLARHSDHALSSRIVERIFSGCVTRAENKKHSDDEPKMSYTDFVWFLLSEEDKRTPTAIEYWFRCMDIDGDGLLSMYELEYFYEEQQQRMESIGIETLPFEDCLCQMLDMSKPQQRDAISLGDLKRCKMTHVFFDTFFNLEKYLDHEQRDPFATQRDEFASDWDRFAAHEYELLISEENG